LDQLDMCNSSATTFLIGASTLLVASIAFWQLWHHHKKI
jgi:hypothetical protein